MSKRRTKKQINEENKRFYELELKFKLFEMYDKIYNENNFELKQTLELENKINEKNKQTKQSVLLDRTFCINCHKKKQAHLKNNYCFQDSRLKYKPFNKKLTEVKI